MAVVSIAGNAVGILVGSIFSDVKVSTNVVPVLFIQISIFNNYKGNYLAMDDLFWILC